MQPPPLVLSTVDNGDGTSTVTVATVNHGQAVTVVPNTSLDTPEVIELYRHVADIENSPYAADRRSGRDRRRQATNPPRPNGSD